MRTLAAGVAVLLACSSLWPLFDGGGWAPEVLGAVLVVLAASLAGRRLGVSGHLQPLVSGAGLAVLVVTVFARDTLRAGALPTGQTVARFETLLAAARADIEQYAAPIPVTTGAVLVVTLAVGALAILVDWVAVALERPAAAGLGLLALLAVPSAALPGGLGGLPFVLTALGWLLLLAVDGSDRTSRWGSTLISKDAGGPGSLGRSARRIGGLALVLAVVLPLAVPGLDRRVIGSAEGSEADQGRSTSARTYNPMTRLRGYLTQPRTTQLLQYRTDDPDPDYLRMTTLDTYDGNGWSASPLSRPREQARVSKGIPVPDGEGGPRRDYRTQVQIDGDRLRVYWLPLPFGPRAVDVRGTWLWDPVSQTVFSASSTTSQLPLYRVEGSRVLPDPARLAAADASDIDPAVQSRYGGPLPVTASVRALTERVIAGSAGPYQRAVAIQRFFVDRANRFAYDLTPPQPRRGEDPLTAFLRDRRGFCQQYSTAMAVMLRLAGLPSRVAVGFTRGTPLPGVPGGYSVTNREAHAWPEAWFAGTGWVRFEPTVSASQAFVPDYARGGSPAGARPTARPSATPKPTGGPSATPTRAPKSLLPEQDEPVAAGRGPGGPSPWLGVPVGAAALAAVPALLTLVRRRRRWREPHAGVAWEQVVDDAADLGYAWPAAESPRTAAARLAHARRLPEAAATALQRIALDAEHHRYAPAGRHRVVDVRARTGEVAVVRAALRQSAATRSRLRARLLPPSTVSWALTGLGDRLELALERWGELVHRAVVRLTGRLPAPLRRS